MANEQIERLYAELAITRDNIDALLDAGALEVAMSNGTWWRIRRNGATKRWKRDPARIYVPFKAGMYTYGAITETHFNGAASSLYSNSGFRRVV
jgi:hypothetical protein